MRTLLSEAAGLVLVAALAACGGGGGGGLSCPASHVLCGEECVNPLTDHDHCGASASCQGFEACASGEVCVAGACAASCPADEIVCGDRCVDPLTDRAFCGADAACAGGAACGAGQVCVAGACATSCPAGQHACDGRCVDPLTDHAYCGAGPDCAGGTACQLGQVCSAGNCATTCPAGQVVCGALCVDPLTDRAFCGADAACAGGAACGAGQVCVAGACATSCPAGQYACGGKCIDPLTDHAYCGAGPGCAGGITCQAGQVCSAGRCATTCPTGQVVCGALCVDPLTDRAFCGADAACAGGTACGAGQVCVAGACATSCPAGQYACGGKCIDPLTDHAYCGAGPGCAGGITCQAGQVCSAGSCATSCPAGQYACGGRCIDPASDPTYCGASAACTGGTACGAGSFCQAGSCWSPCTGGQAFCGGQCISPSTNRAHCGATGLCTGTSSGAACTSDHLCSGGSCRCPAGQTDCAGTCRFGACGSATPGWEWKASVPLTAPPRFKEGASTLAHVVFDGVGMVDSTGHTHWTAVGAPGAVASTMWSPRQLYAGPFAAGTYWRGDVASRDYLRAATSGPFTVCARYKPGLHPGTAANKVVVALGKPEKALAQGTDHLGGWALMQMHQAACFHYFGATGGEWMAPSIWPIDGATLAATEWIWQCGGWDGTGPAGLRENVYTNGAMVWGDGTSPLLAGLPATVELPAIGAYFDGSGALGDGGVYEVIVTSDPATEANMKNLVARASGGMRLANESPVAVVGADGLPHQGPPGVVGVGADGSVSGDQRILLGAALPTGSDPVGQGQCWGLDASASPWSAIDSQDVLHWWSSDGTHQFVVGMYSTQACMSPVPSEAASTCWSRGTLADGSRHTFHLCIAPDRTMRAYLDGAQLGTASGALSSTAVLPRLDDAGSLLMLGGLFSSTAKVWRVWACAGSNPADCP